MFDDKDSKFEVDIENMKVIEIKKKLKALGLPVTGNKSELVERLQVAMISGKEADAEAMILDTASLPDSLSDISPSKLNDQLLLDTPPTPEKNVIVAQDQLVTSVGTPVPLKKRALLQSDVETVKPKKRIVLNRNNFPTPILMPVVEPLKIEASNEADNEKEDAFAVEFDEANKSGSVRKVISLATETKKVLSDAERVLMRAKRFNLTTPLTTEAIKVKNTLEPAKKKDIAQWKSKVPAISPFTIPPNIDVLKKRAERFGENVSTVLKKLEEEEKLNKRKSKFGQGLGEIKAISLDEQEKKKMRAERFGKL